jgi:hypothetical protein
MASDWRFPVAVVFAVLAVAFFSGMLSLVGYLVPGLVGSLVPSGELALRMHRFWFGNRPEISVMVGSYGLNCVDYQVPTGFTNSTATGNVTKQVKLACDGRAQCNYVVDVSMIGDPATGCGKDFSVEYFCKMPRGAEAESQEVKTEFVPAEANGKMVILACK